MLRRRLHEVYAGGNGAERAAVLRALDVLDARLDGCGESLVKEALRSNDTMLVRRAVGAYGSRWLDDAAFRQAVLKCVFTGVPLAAVHGLRERADGELARMLDDYARERAAAGREMPADAAELLRSLQGAQSAPLLGLEG